MIFCCRDSMALTGLLCIAAIVMGFMDDCDQDMKTWFLVYGFSGLAIVGVVIMIFCCFIPCFGAMIKTDNFSPVIMCCFVCLCIIPMLFPLGWLIYGCVLFWPNVLEHPCRLQVIAGTVITAGSFLLGSIDSCLTKRNQMRQQHTEV